MSLLRFLPDNFRDWWKFNSLWTVSRSSGVKTWHFLNFGLQPEHFLSNHFDWLILGHISVFPVFCTGRRSTGCIGSIVAFLYRVVCLPTCLTGWISSFWLSFGSVTVFVVVLVNVVCIVILDRLIGATVSIARFISRYFSLFVLPF